MKHLTTIRHFLVVAAMIFSAVTVKSQDIVQDDNEEIRINTNIGQINVAIEQIKPEPFTIEVTDNGIPVENVKWEAPAKNNPLRVMIIVAMNKVDKWKTNKDGLLFEIKKLKENSAIDLAGINIVNDEDGFGKKMKFSDSYNAVRFDRLDAAVSNSIAVLQARPGSRKAILLLTNEVESLPLNIIERTNDLLGKTSLGVYLMSVNEKGLKNYKDKCKVPCKIVAQTNINGNDVVIFPSRFLSGLFGRFTKLATTLYTVSYDLQDEEIHKIEATVRRTKDNREITKNIREFKTASSNENLAVYTKASFRKEIKKGSDEEAAVKALAGANFDELLKKRAEKLTLDQVNFYNQELQGRPELKGADILPENDATVKKLTQNLAPVLKIYGRENYTKFFVYKGDNPFIGLYRECIIIFSTKALDLLSEEQLRAAVAHELAHEIFIDEIRQADKADSNALRHIVEHKCDLVAVMATSQLKDDPLAVVKASEIFTKFYKENPPASDIGEDRSPSNAARKDVIKAYLKFLSSNLV